MDEEISVLLQAPQHQVESIAATALREWIAHLMDVPVHGIISLGVGRHLLAQTHPGDTSAAAARSSQVVVGVVQRDEFGPDGPAGSRQFVVNPGEVLPTDVARIRLRTAEGGSPGNVRLHISLTPRTPSDDVRPAVDWWKEWAARFPHDVGEGDC